VLAVGENWALGFGCGAQHQWRDRVVRPTAAQNFPLVAAGSRQAIALAIATRGRALTLLAVSV
jgi:hypothetical protein